MSWVKESVPARLALCRDRFDLIDEEHTRSARAGTAEEIAHQVRRLARVLPLEIRGARGDELDAPLVREGARDVGLARARGAVQQDVGYVDPRPLVAVRLAQDACGALELILFILRQHQAIPGLGAVDTFIAPDGRHG